MSLTVNLRHAVTHREEERSVAEIARQQPIAVVAQFQDDAAFRQRGCQLGAWHNGNWAPIGWFGCCSDRGTD